jgi:uncharacterized integral membrane protein
MIAPVRPAQGGPVPEAQMRRPRACEKFKHSSAGQSERYIRHIYLDYFRAISIMIIIAGHSYGSWLHESLAGQSVANMVTGGTALLVFISGFFFKEIFCPRFKFSKFMNKKVQTVLLPYVLLSFAGMALKIVAEGDL